MVTGDSKRRLICVSSAFRLCQALDFPKRRYVLAQKKNNEIVFAKF